MSYSGYSNYNYKKEEELAISLKKALSLEESAPKQKHVRACILYTWDVKGPGVLWHAIRGYQMISENIVVFKALIIFHKVIREGHPNVLKDACNDAVWVDQITRDAVGSQYQTVMQKYVSYLQCKLVFHRNNPHFSGNFDYEEYVSLRGIEDPNEGYETILELLELLEKIDSFQKHVFSNLRTFGNNEARIAALVPLVEESFGIYQFIVSMMTAMHNILGPLRDSFKQHHYKLASFYDDCRGLHFLSSLITIPKLSKDPVDFLARGAPTQMPKNYQKNNDQERREREERERLLREEEMLREQQKLMDLHQQEMQRQKEEELRRMQEQRNLEIEMFNRQRALQEQAQMQSQLMDTAHQLEYYKSQSQNDKNMLNQYEQRLREMQNEISRLSLQGQNGNSQQIQALNNEVTDWKQKYEALAKLYAQLRKEHLDLLTKFKSIKDSNQKVSEDARKSIEKIQADLKAKSAELTEILVERNRLKGDADRIRLQYEGDLNRLKSELEETKKSLFDLSQSKGNEVETLVKRFNQEQQNLESLLKNKQSEIQILTVQLGDVVAAMEKTKSESEEETAVLQATLDQALELLKQHQEQSKSTMMNRDERITMLESKHQQLLNEMMDNVLQSCINTVSDQLFQLDNPGAAKSNVTPEFVLSLIEKCQQKNNELTSSLVKLVNAGDPKDAINCSASYTQAIVQLLGNGCEMERLAQGEDSDSILDFLRNGAQACISFFTQVKSDAMTFVEPSKRPEHIVNLGRETQYYFAQLTPILESIVGKQKQGTLQGDLADAVDREMSEAAKRIQEATQKLQDLLHSQGPELNVNSAILQAAMAITTAIANLIKCATDSQKEIVAQNKGSHSNTAFYKKNNKWTQGLISAAQSVSLSTVYLVEVADGLITKKYSWEQVVVAAQDVGVCTTQLVAAARVKASLNSKTQEKLESAAVSVREATKMLVKAAKDAARIYSEGEAKESVMKMTKHEAKVKEMEQQVKILELEKLLATARFTLGEMRKTGYHQE